MQTHEYEYVLITSLVNKEPICSFHTVVGMPEKLFQYYLYKDQYKLCNAKQSVCVGQKLETYF